jgi:hypothetical protein
MENAKSFHLLDLLEKAAIEAPSNGLIFYGKASPLVPVKITYPELLSNVKVSSLPTRSISH